MGNGNEDWLFNENAWESSLTHFEDGRLPYDMARDENAVQRVLTRATHKGTRLSNFAVGFRGARVALDSPELLI